MHAGTHLGEARQVVMLVEPGDGIAHLHTVGQFDQGILVLRLGWWEQGEHIGFFFDGIGSFHRDDVLLVLLFDFINTTSEHHLGVVQQGDLLADLLDR